MENILYGISYVLTGLVEIYIISRFMCMFAGESTKQKKVLYAMYILKEIVCGVQYACFPNVYLNVVMAFSTLLVISCCYGESFKRRLFSAVITYISLVAAEVVVAGIIEAMGADVVLKGHNGDALSQIGIAIIVCIIYKLVALFKEKNTELHISLSFLLIVILLGLIATFMEFEVFIHERIVNNMKILFAIFYLVVVFLVIYLYDILSKNYKQKLKEEVIKREKSYYAKQAELLEQRSRDIKGIQHDMKNHLFAIGAMVKNKNKDAEKYIDNILVKIISDELYSSTGNIAIDSVINFKLSKASEIGTMVKADIKLPSGLRDGLEDLVTIIGNLLDNAIEALSDIDDNEKRLEIEVRYNIGNVNIDIKNSYNGELNYRNGKIETKKHDKNMHGIGLESVKTAVEKHYGTMDIHHNNKEFHVNIMLYL